jgi:threonine/homoserine/homoserine lactone efflux protein
MLLNLPWLLGVLTLAVLSPGPDFLLVVKNSIGGSRARALATATGISSGVAIQMLLISFGLAATPPGILRGVQLIGVIVLGTLGLRALFARPAEDATSSGSPPPSAHSGFTEGLLCNVTNPKAFVFFVSLYAQIIRPDTTLAWRVFIPVLIVVHGWVVWYFVGLAVQSPPIARRLARAQHWLPRVFGGALVVIAIAVLVDTIR